MPARLRSVRSKMLVPAVLGLVAALVAAAVMWQLSQLAAARLKRVAHEDYIALQFYLELHPLLEREHLLLENVAASGKAATLDAVDDVNLDMLDRIEKQGEVALGAERAKGLRERLDHYHLRARELAARAVIVAQTVAGRKKAAADPNAWNQTTPEEKELDAARAEVEDIYGALDKEIGDGAERARESMAAALREAGAAQERSVAAGAAILLGFSLVSAATAWFFSGQVARPLRALSGVALRIAGGDLTPRVHVGSDDEVGLLARSFERMGARLREIVGTLKVASGELAGAALGLSDHTRAQSALLERQATGVAETSSTTRELEQAASMAAARAASVLDVARRAVDMSDQGRASAERSAAGLGRIQASVASIVGRSAELIEQAHQIGDIVETVRDLATQSHVLSLNASIEAARAGQAGKSFAVVAQEVRALAEQSGQSAERIGRMVEDVLGAAQATRDTTERGSADMAGSLDQIRSSGESLRQIGDIVREQSDSAMEIASSVHQQSTGITQIALAMRDIDRGMEENLERIRSLDLSARQVAETADRIAHIAAEFTV
jgi:methyl-accepting chemotaxis protein